MPRELLPSSSFVREMRRARSDKQKNIFVIVLILNTFSQNFLLKQIYPHLFPRYSYIVI